MKFRQFNGNNIRTGMGYWYNFCYSIGEIHYFIPRNRNAPTQHFGEFVNKSTAILELK